MKSTIRSDFALCKLPHRIGLDVRVAGWAMAAELHVPAIVEAGQGFSIPVAGLRASHLLSRGARPCGETHRESREAICRFSPAMCALRGATR